MGLAVEYVAGMLSANDKTRRVYGTTVSNSLMPCLVVVRMRKS